MCCHSWASIRVVGLFRVMRTNPGCPPQPPAADLSATIPLRAAQAKAALERHIAQHGVLGLPHEAVRIAMDLPPSSELLELTPKRLQALKQATPRYTEAQARRRCFKSDCRGSGLKVHARLQRPTCLLCCSSVLGRGVLLLSVMTSTLAGRGVRTEPLPGLLCCSQPHLSRAAHAPA